MKLDPLNIGGAWVINQESHVDNRGYFREWYLPTKISKELLDFGFVPTQGNVSKSKKGVIRGMHYSMSKVGQEKWITCTTGRILDVILDVRPDSNTYGMFEMVELSESNGRSIYIKEGIAHGFITLADDSVVTYLTNTVYRSEDECIINPFDPDIQIPWPKMNYVLSKKDENAPSLDFQKEMGLLP
jgi:dTDP-4-dehydrorhamnose 3,5-epimerase